MQANRSPVTGSSRLPSRSSTFVTPFRARLKAANPSARRFTSVATTCSAWRESRSAWIPFPVQASSARSTGSLMVRCARTAEGRWTPATRSAPSTSSRSDAIRRSSWGTTRTSPCRDPPRSSARPAATSSSACSPAGTGSPSSSSEMSAERLSGTAASRRRYTSRSTCVKIGSPRRVQAAGDPGTRVAGSRELVPQSLCTAGRRRDRRRLQILTFFDRSQPACTGASREPSAFCGL